ncbi:DUF979 domain-containing protein [Streptantibioticus rubrisoli]|uniref:DUF979 domain-containing protein n=1 Tax=Streptantibioticus rubrisoli TaxID=1387313 RepID=A0ABT1P9B7_9ACTN|nr:DUF979 domain-containing protein [Streptantibioticus rubrisoli]MCQ4041954.1 DUF979 domain-containing protein [Streptantibioticus rubrisoli]
MIKAEWFYWLVGAVFLAMAGQMFRDRTNPRRLGTAAFWGLVGAAFIYSTWVANKTAPAEPLGAAVLVMVCLAGFGRTGRGTAPTASAERRAASAARLGNRLFVPALTIPLVAMVCAVVVKGWHIGRTPVLQTGSETILGLGIGTIVALVVAMVMVGERRPTAPLHAGRGLLETMGYVLLLPQLLATLGSIFQASGVGASVGKLTEHVLPHGQTYLAVIVYCVGMAVFTVIMGNGFAAFPVLTAAVGWPVLVQQAHGKPAVVLAAGMLAGFCGTLCTPMAANYNLVPATLLELKDQYGPIRAQIPTAVALLACNIVIISAFAF